MIYNARFIQVVEPSHTSGSPFRMRDHYSNIIGDIYALTDAFCDSSDISCIEEEMRSNTATIMALLNSEESFGYTHIIRDKEGSIFAITIGTK